MRGAVAWAFTTFQPEAPFELIGVDRSTGVYSTANVVAQTIRDGELGKAPTFLVAAKLRPLVFLQDRPRGVLPEYAALKLARFGKLSESDQRRIRDGDEPALFYLPSNKGKYGLADEYAIDLNSLVRVHRSAVLTRPIGYLDENEIDVLGRRLATVLDIDLQPAIRQGVIEQWEELVAAQPPGRESRE